MELDFLPDAGHDAVEDEEKATSGDSEEQLIPPESAPALVGSSNTLDLRLAKQTPTPSAREKGPGKAKRWRANMGGMLPYPRSLSTTSCSFIDSDTAYGPTSTPCPTRIKE